MKTRKIFEMESYGGRAINNIIYNIIKPNSRVLDLGCGNGILGEFLKKDKNCYVSGLEVDKTLVEKARGKLDSIICADIRDLNNVSLDEKFDYVVCADILEHIMDPQSVLHVIKNFITPDGYLLVSMPNIANWRIRLELLMGKFEYRPLTITDPGHLRFYTKYTAKKLLAECGYTVKKILPKNSAYKSDFLIRWLGRLWGSLFAYQLIFVARIKDGV